MNSKPSECLVPIDQLTDDLLVATKGDFPNLLVGIGFLGGITTFLNPTNVADIIARYEAIAERPVDNGDSAMLLGFNDMFEAYEFRGCE